MVEGRGERGGRGAECRHHAATTRHTSTERSFSAKSLHLIFGKLLHKKVKEGTLKKIIQIRLT